MDVRDRLEACPTLKLRVHQGNGGRGGVGDLMVVEHERIDAPLAQPGDGFNGGGAAINGQKQRRRMFGEAILHAGLTEAVAFVHAVRQVGADLPAERGENFGEQRRGSHAVHVVVAEDDERFVTLARGEEAFDSSAHVREQERIGKILQAGLKEPADGLRFAEAAVEQALDRKSVV